MPTPQRAIPAHDNRVLPSNAHRSAGVIIEKRCDIAGCHRSAFGTHPREKGARAEEVVNVPRRHGLESRTRFCLAPQSERGLPKAEPRGQPVWNPFEGLFVKVEGGNCIAIRQCPFGIGKTAVGEQIAGTLRETGGKGSGRHISVITRFGGRRTGEAMKASELLHPRPEGLYCPPGDFYVDAMRPVPRALITHAHSDHARPGHGAVMASRETLAIMALRLGEGFCETRQEAKIGEWVDINGVESRFSPQAMCSAPARSRCAGRA